jgi:homoserine kinase
VSLLRVRAPATTANLGPGYDCAAVALDLWNELEVSDGDEVADVDHLGVEAFARLAPVEGKSFAFVDRKAFPWKGIPTTSRPRSQVACA